ncbi:MAG: hypothetical protein HQK83_09635 [Fibrobacteria bacterium]|nr:hypothetical protein [Fibrobacteria bacterium]
MKHYFFIFLFVVTGIVTAQEAPETDTGNKYRFIIGAGGGPEAGLGLHLGIQKQKNALRLGMLLMYNGDESGLLYSTGLRYFRFLTNGRINDTYAWAGTAITGSNDSESTDFFQSSGFGLGVSYHFGLPFHLDLDSGLRLTFDKDDPNTNKGAWYIGPTFNGALTYQW